MNKIKYSDKINKLQLLKKELSIIKPIIDFSEQIKSTLPNYFEDISEIVAMISKYDDSKLSDFYNNIDNDFERLFTASLHIEFILKKIISKYLELPLIKVDNNDFYELINILYYFSVIDNNKIYLEEELFQELHKFRLLRNKFAHTFLCKESIDFTKLREFIATGEYLVFELTDQLNSLNK